MHEPDEFNIAKNQRLSFYDFIEALCRLACMKSLPSDEEVSTCMEDTNVNQDDEGNHPVKDSECPLLAYYKLVQSGDTNHEGKQWPMKPPPPLYGTKDRSTGEVAIEPDTRMLHERGRKLFLLIFDRLRDADLDLTADGKLEQASSQFLTKMEKGYQLAIGNTPPKETWRSIHNKRKAAQLTRVNAD